MRKGLKLLIVICILMLNSSCAVKQQSTRDYRFEESSISAPEQFVFEAFDTQCSISLYGVESKTIASQLFYDMKRVVDNYEKVFSKTVEGSEIYDINHRTGNSVMICNETAAIFDIAKDFYEWSGRRFDISSGTLIDLWDIKNRKTIPTLEEINEARKHIGNYKYAIERDVDKENFRCNKITFFGDELTQYDFGALVKGYCCDELKRMLDNNKIIKACIVNLGGNVLCTGELEGREGSSFRVGIFKPFSGNEIIDTVSVKNRCVITSGNYQRYFKVDGDDRVYHHIIDPTTGYPSNNGLDSVTIVSVNGLLGDYLSTTCMMLGEEGSKKIIDFFRKEFSDKNIQATFVYSDGKISKYPAKVNTIK